MLELKIVFQELDWLTLFATFENHRVKLINVVAELFGPSPVRDMRRRMKLKAVGHVIEDLIWTSQHCTSADLIATF